MESVAEFVEKGGDLFEGEEGGFVPGGLGEVSVVGDHRSDPFSTDDRLVPEGVHPGSAPLGGTGEVVGVEDSHGFSVSFENLEDPHVLMVLGNVFSFHELEAVELTGNVKGSLENVFEFEVRTEGLFVQVVLGLADLLGVIPPVPGLELEARVILLPEGFPFGGFL